MRRSVGWLRPALVVLLAVMAVFTFSIVVPPSPAAAATCPAKLQGFPLHAKTATSKASCGQHVSDLQWLLHGGKPYALHQVKPTFKGQPNGSYGAITKHDVIALKFRIGYPAKGQCKAKTSLLTDTTSRYFFYILEGKASRPTCWVGLAGKRVKGAVRTGQTVLAQAIRMVELSQLGVHEIGTSNRGPCISTALRCMREYVASRGPYQGSTGAYGAAWCASFATWALKIVLGHGFGSSNDAFVPTIAEHARQMNWLAAKPRFGSFAVFLSPDLLLVDAYHIGYVVKVTASGVQTIEGNAGVLGAVAEVWRAFASNRMVYVNVPGVA